MPKTDTIAAAQWVPIAKLKPKVPNPRFIRDDKFRELVKSIRDFPKMLLLRPLVVDDDYVLLGGNQRLLACKAAGLKKVPVLLASGLSEAERERFVIADNLPFGQWDTDILANHYSLETLADWGMDVDFLVHGADNDDDQPTPSQGEARSPSEAGNTRDEDPEQDPAGAPKQGDPNLFPLGITVNKVQQLQWSQIKDQLNTKRDSEAFTRLLDLLKDGGITKITPKA